MKQVIPSAAYAVIGLYDKVRKEIDELIKRGEVKRTEAQMLLDAPALFTKACIRL